MKVSDFDFELPPERIAERPVEPRDRARLLVHELASGATRHLHVADLPDVLSAGDLLVVNDTRVRAARLIGRRASGGAVELLLVEPLGGGAWRALARPAKRLAAGEVVEIEDGALRARMAAREGEHWCLVLEDPRGAPATPELVERAGRMPLPPYIGRPRDPGRPDPDRERDRVWYQTVFAREAGAVAAPTAGLHFTPELLERLGARGVERAALTLHVGEGTFRPVVADDTEEVRLHAEAYELPARTAEAIARCHARGGRVVAVGTTTLRALETRAADDGAVAPGGGTTAIFLRPGVPIRSVDALLTNFHLPRSTLLMLVAALAGRERTLALYREAIERGYRFYSYGDAMLLLRR